MRLRQVWLVYQKEMRETLRDRKTLVIMVLLPLALYPLVVVALGEGVTSEKLKREQELSRVGITGPPWDALERALKQDAHVLLSRNDRAEAMLRGGELDLTVVVPRGFADELARGGTVRLKLLNDQARDRSKMALGRVQERLDHLDGELREARLKARGLPATLARPIQTDEQNVAGGKALGARILQGALPMLVVLMVLLGAFYPAIDLTAGEKERGTLETLLVAPVRRTEIIAGKYLVVATVATVTGLLNLGSIGVSFGLGFRAMMNASKLPIELPWSALLLTVVALVPAALFFAAVMVAVAALARSFKEAQNLLTPIYLVCITPAALSMLPWVELSPLTAVLPVVNISLLTREIIGGKMPGMPVVLCLASCVLYTVVALKIASLIYSSERLLFAPEPLARRLRGPAGSRRGAGSRDRPEPVEAAVVLMAVMALIVLVGQQLQSWDLITGLLATEWLLIALPVALLLRMGRLDPRATLGLYLPRGKAILGAIMAGASGWLLVTVLVEGVQQRVMPIPKELLEEMEKLLFSGDRSLAVDLAVMAVSPAICEELLFRGVLLRATAGRPGLSVTAVVLINGLLFGLFHLSIYRFLPTAVLGTVLAFIALRSGSILPSMTFHLLNNASAVLAGRFLGEARAGGAATDLLGPPMMLLCAAVFAVGLALVARGGIRARPAGPPGPSG